MKLRSSILPVVDQGGQSALSGEVWCLKLHEHLLASWVSFPEVFLTLILFHADEIFDLREHVGGVARACDLSDFDFVSCLDSQTSCWGPFAVAVHDS